MSAGDFSLLLPVYAGNSVEEFREAFESSVHRQTLRPDEVVVVEDGPLDPAVLSALEAFEAESPSTVTRVRIARNGGLAAALNAGLAATTTEFVARMDADDVSAPNRFERQLPVMRERSLDVLGAALAEFRGSVEQVDAVRVPPIGAQQIRRSVPFRQPFNHPTVVMRRLTVLEAGGYPTDVGRFEDYVLFARLIAGGAVVDNLPETLLYYRADDAYHRRGGWAHFRAEVSLQRELRRIGITTPVQWARNVLLRGPYRLVPVGVRARAYRQFATRPSS